MPEGNDPADRRQEFIQKNRRQAKLKKWTPHRSGALVGFASVQFPSAMIIHDLRLMTGKRGHWIALPAIKQSNSDGQPRTDANGKAIYNPIIEFADRITADRFRDLVVDLIRREHPEAFEEEGSQ